MAAKPMIDAYFRAFNKHDPEAVAALFGGSGKYQDSAVSAGLNARQLKDYLVEHFKAFPDARYRVLRAFSSRDGISAFEWRFTATNAGPLGDAPATNRTVDVSGASLMQVKKGKIAWLRGYFDRRSMLKQLGA